MKKLRASGLLWLTIGALAALFISGGVLWGYGVTHLSTIQTAQDEARKGVPASVQEAERRYAQALTDYSARDYATAAILFDQVYGWKADYREAAAYRLLSHYALGQAQAKNLTTVAFAAANLQIATNDVRYRTAPLEIQYARNPALLPSGVPSFAVLAQQITDVSANADSYAAGSAVQDVTPGWWNVAIPAWEAVYARDANYLRDQPNLAVNTRLADAYYTKALWVCRTQADGTTAATAMRRAVEIAVKSGLSQADQTTFLTYLSYITRTRCQS